MSIKILLLGNLQSCALLQAKLNYEEIVIVGTVSNENSVLDEINRTSPDLILISDTSPMALRSCQQIYLLRPRSVPIMVSDIDDVALMQKVMQSGVHYILSAKLEPLILISELKGIYNNEVNRILAIENENTSSNKSKVILIFGPKDGVGKSTLAVNLAVKLAQNKNKVAVLDFDFQFGDISAIFGAESKKTVLELIQEQGNPNIDTIRQFLSLHISGVNFLPSPNNPEYSDSVSRTQAEKIISALRVYYDYVIVDCVAMFNEFTATYIDCASTILFMTTKDIPALRNAKKALTVINAFTGLDKVKLVIAKDIDGEIKDKDIANVLSIPVWHKIPYEDKAAINAANQGIPLVTEYPRSRISQEIALIASKLDGGVYESEEKKPQKWGFWQPKGE